MLDKTRKQKIGDKDYTFKMTNKSILEVDEKYGNYGNVISGLMEGEKFYTNALKLISYCCIERDFTIDELVEQLTPKQLNMEIPNLATELYFDYMGFNDDDETEEKEKKQEGNSPKNSLTQPTNTK